MSSPYIAEKVYQLDYRLEKGDRVTIGPLDDDYSVACILTNIEDNEIDVGFDQVNLLADDAIHVKIDLQKAGWTIKDVCRFRHPNPFAQAMIAESFMREHRVSLIEHRRYRRERRCAGKAKESMRK